MPYHAISRQPLATQMLCTLFYSATCQTRFMTQDGVWRHLPRNQMNQFPLFRPVGNQNGMGRSSKPEGLKVWTGHISPSDHSQPTSRGYVRAEVCEQKLRSCLTFHEENRWTTILVESLGDTNHRIHAAPPRLGLKGPVLWSPPKCKEPGKRRSKSIGQRQPTPWQPGPALDAILVLQGHPKTPTYYVHVHILCACSHKLT